jgi:hypothetical protein
LVAAHFAVSPQELTQQQIEEAGKVETRVEGGPQSQARWVVNGWVSEGDLCRDPFCPVSDHPLSQWQ